MKDKDCAPEYSIDHFFNGRVMVRQSRLGYRFSIDAVLLAGFIQPRSGDRIIEVGAGCGIIPLLLAYRNPEINVVGVEIQPELVETARHNVLINEMEKQIEIIHADIKGLESGRVGGPFDVMACNPPYRKSNSGRVNPNLQKAVARHEIKVTLEDIVKAGQRFLKNSGRFMIIYPAVRAIDLLFAMRENGIEPKILQTIHSYRHSPAKLILVEGIKGAGKEVEIQPPIYIYNADGTYTDAVQRIMSG